MFFALSLLSSLLVCPLFGSPLPQQPLLRTEVVHAVSGAVLTLQKSLQLQLIHPGMRVEEKMLDHDLKELAQAYQSVRASFIEENGTTILRYHVVPFPHITKIIWRGISAAEQKTLLQKVGLKEGASYEKHRNATHLRTLQEELETLGYFGSSVDLEEQYNDAAVTLTFTIKKGIRAHLRAIDVKGLPQEIDGETLKASMVFSPYVMWRSWFTQEGKLSEGALDYEKQRWQKALIDAGYPNAHIEFCTQPATPSLIDLSINITANEKHTITDFSVTGIEVPPNLIQDLQVGRPFSPSAMEAARYALYDHLNTLGYLDAQVQFRHTMAQPQKHTLSLEIKPGQQYHVGSILIEGLDKTGFKVVLHRVALHPGAVWNMEKAQQTKRALHALGFFENIVVYPAPQAFTAEDKHYKDVVVSVKEKEDIRIQLGIGFGTADRLSGTISYATNNFSLHALARSWTKLPRGDGETLNLNATFGSRRVSYSVAWSKPFWLDSNWELGQSFMNDLSRLQDTLKTRQRSWSGTLSRPLKENWHYRTGLALEKVTTVYSNSDPIFNDPELSSAIEDRPFISSHEHALTYNTLPLGTRPHTGQLVDLSCKYFGLGSPYQAMKTHITWNAFWPLFDQWSRILMRCEITHLFPLKSKSITTVPYAQRLFISGDDLRGYRNGKIGPLSEKGTPHGGLSRTYLSFEMDRIIKEDAIDFFLFLDTAHLDRATCRLQLRDLSLGYGIRFMPQPGMKIAVGWGYPLTIPASEKLLRKKNFFFTLGM